MPRIFLSHSSRDNRQAIALRKWLIEQDPPLAEEIFLDLDAEAGIRSGVRWKDALRQASARCEAVICLLSANWAASAECRTEFRFAEYLNKRIFSARIGPLVTDNPTMEWQQIDLFGDGPTTVIDAGDRGEPVQFLSEGLFRLRDGILGAGIGAETFVWPPSNDRQRVPYRGWEPLEEVDAAVFFGRDAQILRGLDGLRGMRHSGLETMFVVLGPSGTGKSSFLRAGLVPRLRRDDRDFVVLDIVRPHRSVLSGDTGLAKAIHRTRTRLELSAPNLGQIKRACLDGNTSHLREWLHEAQLAAAARLLEERDELTLPTLVLPVDQAEELFGADAGHEAPQFLGLIAELAGATDGQARKLGLIVAVTIRTDRYQALQTVPQLARVGSVLFDELKAMPRTEFKEVIIGPAERSTQGGRPLEVQPALVNQLLDDCTEGGDTLPLLALSLARLHEDYASDGVLTLPDYVSMGGMRSVVQSEIDGLLDPDEQQRAEQLRLLRAAFIPWLATVNPDNDQPMRRVARWRDLPPESRPLLERFLAKRLLTRDLREDEIVVEVALESLLRQWDELARWLAEEREDLKGADNLERAAQLWDKSARNEAWLLVGTRLVDAERLAAKSGFHDRLAPIHEFLAVSRRREQERLEAESRRRAAELEVAKDRQQAAEALAAAETEAREKAQAHAAVLRRRSLVLRVVVVVTLLVAAAAVYGFVAATKATNRANQRTNEALGLRLTSQGTAMLTGVSGGGDIRGLQEILASDRIEPTRVGGLFTAVLMRIDTEKIINTGVAVMDVAFSADGSRVVSGGADHTVRVWDANTGQPVGAPMMQANTLTDAALSGDGHDVAFANADNTLRVWDAVTGQPDGPPMTQNSAITTVDLSDDGTRTVAGFADGSLRVWNSDTGQPISQAKTQSGSSIASVAFGNDGQRVVSGSADGTVRVWDANTGLPISPPMAAHAGMVMAVAFSPDAQRVVSGGVDHIVREWNANSGQPVAPPMTGNLNTVTSVVFSPDGQRVVSGGYDGTLRVWDADSAQSLAQPMTGHQGAINSVAFSPDGHRLLTGGDDATLRVWDADVGPQPAGTTIGAGTPTVTSVTISTDRRRVLSGNRDGSLRLWDTDTRAPLQVLANGQHDAVTSVAFSTDGHKIVSGSANGTMQLWDADTHAPIGTVVQAHRGAVTGLVFSADGQRVASGGADDNVRLWNADTRQAIGNPLTGHTAAVLALAFSPDGRQLVSGSKDTTLRLWNADTGQPVGVPLTGHLAAVTAVEFGPEGGRIVSRSDDHTVRLWDASTVRPIGAPLNAHTDYMLGIAFSPDGQQLLATGADATRRLFPAPALSAWPSMVCAKLSQNMSNQQWHDWVSPDIGYVQVCPGLPAATAGAAQ
jgi:WD40 repeat protein